MASDVQAFEVTIPAGTLQSAPQITDLAMPPRMVTSVEIRVPSGPRGLVGFQLGAADAQMIPATPGAFVVTDDEVIVWPLENYIDSGAWQCIAYNLGQYDHTLRFRFLCTVIDSAPTPTLTLISAETLSSPLP